MDNGSTDGAAQYVAEHFPSATVIRLPQNRGVAVGRNAGLRQARGEYILILDDDTEAGAEAIDAMQSWLDGDPGTAIVGTALRDAEGRLQQSYKPYPGLRQKVANVLRAKLRLKEKEPQLPSGPIHPEYIIGACQMMRRSLLDEIGLLDEAIFYGPEDADLCLRATAAGHRVTYLPQPSIIHKWRRITTRRLTSGTARRHLQGLLHLYRKHRRWW